MQTFHHCRRERERERSNNNKSIDKVSFKEEASKTSAMNHAPSPSHSIHSTKQETGQLTCPLARCLTQPTPLATALWSLFFAHFSFFPLPHPSDSQLTDSGHFLALRVRPSACVRGFTDHKRSTGVSLRERGILCSSPSPA